MICHLPYHKSTGGGGRKLNLKRHTIETLREKTAGFTATKTSSTHKENSMGSEAFLSQTGGMSAMLHEFLPEQSVPITY